MGLKRYAPGILLFLLGGLLFVLGVYLVQDLIMKFLKFAIGLFLIFISLSLILGALGWWRFIRRPNVTRFYNEPPK
jgi:uncharacterized membrane protein YfcA